MCKTRSNVPTIVLSTTLILLALSCKQTENRRTVGPGGETKTEITEVGNDPCGSPPINQTKELSTQTKLGVKQYVEAGANVAKKDEIVQALKAEDLKCDVLLYRVCRVCIASGAEPEPCLDLARYAIDKDACSN